jgi:hypothetical protein
MSELKGKIFFSGKLAVHEWKKNVTCRKGHQKISSVSTVMWASKKTLE